MSDLIFSFASSSLLGQLRVPRGPLRQVAMVRIKMAHSCLRSVQSVVVVITTKIYIQELNIASIRATSLVE